MVRRLYLWLWYALTSLVFVCRIGNISRIHHFGNPKIGAYPSAPESHRSYPTLLWTCKSLRISHETYPITKHFHPRVWPL